MTVTLMNHVGITVPDLRAAVAWYRDVLGLNVHLEEMEVTNDGGHLGSLVRGLFGERFEKVRMAHLTTADGAGVELFEFIEPQTEVGDSFQYWKSGIFHFCLTVDDVAATAAAIEAAGGTKLSQAWSLFSNKDYQVAYTQDPWGTVIELCNRAYSTVWSNHEPPVT